MAQQDASWDILHGATGIRPSGPSSRIENPIVLLERLNAVGIQIELRSGRLRVSGPRAVVTPEVIETIEVNRAPRPGVG